MPRKGYIPRRESAADPKYDSVLALEKTLNSKEHQDKAASLSLEPRVIKGAEYVKFLKDNEVSTKTLMGW